MRVLLPFLALYRRHWIRMSLGMLLAIVTLLASIGLLTLSGWFLSASALAGLAGLITFNYMLPAAGVRGAAIIRTAGRYAERLVSHDATFRVLSHLRVFTFSRLIPLSPGGLARFRQAELLNRLVADVDTLDHLYLRVISPLLSAVVIIAVVVCGLGWLDLRLALTLGGIMLALLLGLPTLFYLAGKPVGATLTALRADYRTQLVGWIRANAELAVYGALETFRQRLDHKERQWQRQQQRQAALGALSQGIMILASGLTFTLILWLAAAGIAGDPRPGALIALFVFAALAAFEALAPVAGAFQHLGQVIASAERVGQLIDQTPQVRFPESGKTLDDEAPLALTLDDLHFTYPGQARSVLNGVTLALRAGEHVALLGRTGCGKSTLLQLLTRLRRWMRGPCAAPAPSSASGFTFSAPRCAITCCSPIRRPATHNCATRCGRSVWTPCWRIARWTPGWATAVGRSPAASSDAWASLVRCCTARRCCCWMNPPKGWMRKPSARF